MKAVGSGIEFAGLRGCATGLRSAAGEGPRAARWPKAPIAGAASVCCDLSTKEALAASAAEFGGKVLEPVAFLSRTDPALCAAFLRLHELTLNQGAVSRKHKFLIHAAITAAQHDREATAMDVSGALNAGATEQETTFTVIPVAGMPAFGVFLAALQALPVRRDNAGAQLADQISPRDPTGQEVHA